MKPKLLLTALLSFYFYLLSSQVPQGFNYQAIARGSDGKEIPNTTMQIRLSVLSDTNGYYSTGLGVAVWEEEQTVRTNEFGLFSLMFGLPAAIKTRGTVDHFRDINWKSGPLFIGTKINYNSNWRILGTAPLLSVPYSMVAGELAGTVKNLEVSGEDAQSDEALFEVKRKDGELIFGVYNHGVRVNVPVDTLTKAGRKGGFAIGSFSKTKGSDELFIVTADSIRAYIDPDDSKARKGGFAIGSFSTGKQDDRQKYLLVTDDSTRVFIDDKLTKAGRKGGFAIGGFAQSKGNRNFLRVTPDSTRIFTIDTLKGFGVGDISSGESESYLKLTPSNYFIGHESGKSNKTGLYNSFLGYQAGKNNSDGNENSFIGYQSGLSNISGYRNNFIGYKVGISNTSGSENVIIGNEAGKNNTSGNRNVFVGNQSGYSNNNGSDNSFFGITAGYSNTTGSKNTFIGSYAGNKNEIGSNNTFFGNYSGFNNDTASYNVFIGDYAGENNKGQRNVFIGSSSGSRNRGDANIFLGINSGIDNKTGSSNVFIGNYSGYQNETGEYNIFIGPAAGSMNKGGNKNIMIGFETGYSNQNGKSNVYIGSSSGFNNQNGYHNVFLGDSSGYGDGANGGWQNTFIGAESGKKTKYNYGNTFVGALSGYNNTSGMENVIIGDSAGMNNGSNNYNVYIGARTAVRAKGYFNTFSGAFTGQETTGNCNSFYGIWSGTGNTTGSYNSFYGSYSGLGNQTGISNAYFGHEAGYNSNSGSFNSFFGTKSGNSNNTGRSNIYVGYRAGFSNSSGNYNVLAGDSSGYNNLSSKNVFLGSKTGFNNINGSGNIFLGYQAGYNELTSNRLYIDNSSTSAPLIYGDFTDGSEKLVFNGIVGIGIVSPSQKLEIGGDNSKIYLNSSTANNLYFNTSGVGPPSMTIRSYGTKLVLYPSLSSSAVDFALGIDNSTLWYSVPVASPSFSHKFYAGTTELMRIRGDGNVGIGTTSPGFLLEIVNPSFVNAPSVTIRNSSTGDAGLKFLTSNGRAFLIGIDYDDGSVFKINQANGFDTQKTFTISGSNNTALGRISLANRLEVEGNASKTAAGDWLANSDSRIKTNISDIENAKEILLKLHPVKFHYNESWRQIHPSIEDRYYFNFIAQEYRNVFPESVVSSGEYLDNDSEPLMQLDSYNAQIVTIKAVQELILENQNLQSELQSLREEIQQIKTALAGNGSK